MAGDPQNASTWASAAEVVLSGSLRELRSYDSNNLAAEPQHGGPRHPRLGAGQNLVFLATQRRADLPETVEILRYLIEECGLKSDQTDGQLHQTPLFFAARFGSAGCLAYLLDQRANMQTADQNAQTPLFYAARHGQLDCVNLLLERRSSPQAGDVNGQTALFYAVKYSQISCMHALFRAGCDAESARDKWGRTALFHAEDSRACKLLLEQKCEPNVRDMNQQSALFFAARNGRGNNVRLLLKWRGDVHVRDVNRQTPLFFACESGKLDCCRALIEEGGSDPHAKDSGQPPMTPLRLALEPRSNPPHPKELVAYFQALDQQRGSRKSSGGGGAGPPPKNTGAGGTDGTPQSGKRRRGPPANSPAAAAAPPLKNQAAPSAPIPAPSLPARPPMDHPVPFDGTTDELPLAVRDSTPEQVALLFLQGSNPKVYLDTTGRNLIFQAASRPPDKGEDAQKVCQLLVEEHGLHPTYVDLETQTPLFYAVRQGHADVAAYLIKVKCSLQHSDVNKRSPLFFAAHAGSISCAELLLDMKADANHRDISKRTPVFEAATAGHPQTLDLLLNRGGQADAMDIRCETVLGASAPKCVKRLVAAGCDPNFVGEGGKSPCFLAVERGDSAKIAALVEVRADLHARGAYGESILHHAVISKQLKCVRDLIANHGADLAVVDAQGLTPAARAKASGWPKGAVELEQIERDIQQRDEQELQEKKRRVAQLAHVVRNGPVAQVRDLLQSTGSKACFEPGGGSATLLFDAAQRPSDGSDEALDVCKCLVEEVGLDPLLTMPETGQNVLFESAAAGNEKVCMYLMERRCDVQFSDIHGRSALFSSVQRGHAAATTALLEGRADIFRSDGHRQTPLFFAMHKDPSCMQLLLDANASVEVTDSQGQTPLFPAASQGLTQSMTLLVAARASIATVDHQGGSAFSVALQASHGEAAAMLLDECDAGRGQLPANFESEVSKLANVARERDLVEVVDRLKAIEDKVNARLEADLALQEGLFKVAMTGTADEFDDAVTNGADVATTDSTGRTCAHIAAARCDEEGPVVCRRLVEKHGVTPDLRDARERTPLFASACEGAEASAACLLDCKADPNAADADGDTPLFHAARHGRGAMCGLLLRRDAKVDQRNALRQTVLFCVVRPAQGTDSAGAPLPEISPDDRTAVLQALKEGGVTAHVRDVQGQSPLFNVVDVDCAKYLIEQSCDVEVQDNQGRTALIAAVRRTREDVAGLLLESGASLTLEDEDGREPLHHASGAGCAKLLIQRRADLDARDKSGQTPLFEAARRGDGEVLSALVTAGAKVDALDNDKQTALFVAARHASLEVVQQLVNEASAEPSVRDGRSRTAAQLAAAWAKQDSSREAVAKFLEGAEEKRTGARQGDAGVERSKTRTAGASGGGPEKRRRYCILFDDPTDPSGCRRIPFQTAEYEEALRRLATRCPWLRMDRWDPDAPLTRGTGATEQPPSVTVGGAD